MQNDRDGGKLVAADERGWVVALGAFFEEGCVLVALLFTHSPVNQVKDVHRQVG